MNIFDIHNIKAEKQNEFKILTKLFRLIELFLALVLISWIINQLPFVFKIFTEYFRHLFSLIVSPLFIFLVGNVIVLTLVLKSGHLVVDFSATDLYQEFLNNPNEDIDDSVLAPRVPEGPEPEEIVYQDKQIISEGNTNRNIKTNTNEETDTKHFKVISACDKSETKYDQLKKPECEIFGKLKRSETEIGRRKAVEEKSVNDVVEELSNEEFNRRIEGFIARQLRFHQEEKLSIVVPKSVM